MSKKKFVSRGDGGFWAYDVALGVFLKHLIDVAEGHGYSDVPWLNDEVSSWRVAACVPDLGLSLDAVSSTHVATFISLARQACDKLSARGRISSEEVASWTILKDLKIHPRGAEEIEAGPVVHLGWAIIELATGTLPPPPDGTIWLYGAPTGLTTLPLPSRR
jgi:hypothetical protein